MPNEVNSTLHRVRFETRVIAPAKLPDFAYVASVLTHSTIQFTALVNVRDDEESAASAVAVKACWPDAIIQAVQVGAPGFRDLDLKLTQNVFGTVRTAEERKPPALIRWWFSLFGYVPTRIKDGSSAFLSGTAIRCEGTTNHPQV